MKKSTAIAPAGTGTKLETQRPKPIRLNEKIRKYLTDIVPNIVVVTDEQKQVDDLNAKVTKMIEDHIRGKYPAKDLEVLRAYQSTCTIESAAAHNSEGTRYKNPVGDNYYSTFVFSSPIEVPSRHNSNNKATEVPDNIIKMIGELEELVNQLKIIRIQKIRAYENLIYRAKTLDELAVVWVDVADYFKKYAEDNGLLITADNNAVVIVQDDSNARVNNAD